MRLDGLPLAEIEKYSSEETDEIEETYDLGIFTSTGTVNGSGTTLCLAHSAAVAAGEPEVLPTLGNLHACLWPVRVSAAGYPVGDKATGDEQSEEASYVLNNHCESPLAVVGGFCAV